MRAISFTGSTEVGKKIQVKCSANLTRTQLELGGKNALIVMDDADLGEAVGAAAIAGFSNGGQWCTSTSRILLHKGIAKPFLEALTARCEKMNVGDGLLETTDMGPVAGPDQFRDISKAIEQAKADGATMIAGAKPADPAGYFIRPTVFTNVKTTMPMFRDEIFGPVLAVCEFGSLDEAIELANNSIYGLSSAIFTKSLCQREEVRRRNRGRPGSREHPHRIQGTLHAFRRRQAVGRRVTGEQPDGPGVLCGSKSRLRPRLISGQLIRIRGQAPGINRGQNRSFTFFEEWSTTGLALIYSRA